MHQTDRILQHPKALCHQVRRLVLEAGQATLPFYHMAETLTVTIKADGSPVTEADKLAEAIIEKGLKEIAPTVPMIGEEAVSEGRIPDISQADYFWLVDPVDGTRGFASGDYTVNVALIHKGEPILGVVYAPAHGELYAAAEGTAIRYLDETQAEKKLQVRPIPREGFTVITNRTKDISGRLSHFLDHYKVAKTLHLGSSLKICLIAAGKADIYPRFGRISEWDIAAADAILRASGGSIIDLHGKPIVYGQAEKLFAAPEFIASSAQIEVDDMLESVAAFRHPAK